MVPRDLQPLWLGCAAGHRGSHCSWLVEGLAAQRLMKIAEYPRIVNTAHAPLLDDALRPHQARIRTWALAMERGIIRPDMERKDLAPLHMPGTP